MSKSAARSSFASSSRFLSFFFVLLLSLFTFAISTEAVGQNQSAPKPLRASQLVALEAGGSLQANIAYDIGVRGVNFHPDEEFLQMMTKAGADAGVIAALKAAKVDGDIKPDKQLVQALTDAAVLMKSAKYAEAGAKLSEALDNSFARMETGFAMAELMRREEKHDVAQSVYAEILETEPDFPEVHDKASYILYKLDDTENAIKEANIALQQNANDAEAHKNKGLALEQMGKFDAAITEYKEALRIKPDYAVVRYDLGLLYHHRHDEAHAIEAYKESLALDPNSTDAHNHLGLEYQDTGNLSGAITEYREAKRLAPDDPMYRQNLASALMQQDPHAAIVELRELETKFPNFEMCHICLGNGLLWDHDLKGAEAEFRTAMKLDPADAEPHDGLGRVYEAQKNNDAALQEFRAAEQLGGDASSYKNAGIILKAKKDYAGAIKELKQAEALEPSNWEIHEIYAEALEANGQNDLAISEYKEAIELDGGQWHVRTELASVLEKKGDWVKALEEYRKGALGDASRIRKAQMGQSVPIYPNDPQKSYKLAKARFADYLVSLKAAGKKDEAATLAKEVEATQGSEGMEQKVQAAMQEGDEAVRARDFEAAEKAYKNAAALAEQLPPGDENLIIALGKVGNAYANRRDFTDAEATFHRQLTLIEKVSGPMAPRLADPLLYLGMIAAQTGNFASAESYLQRRIDICVNAFGENSGATAESFRSMAGLYESRSQWDKAEALLLRAVRAEEPSGDNDVLIPLWGLCDLYDRAGKPDKAQPCWNRATGIVANQVGQNSPKLEQSLNSEAADLRKLGRADEAQKIEERVANIKRTAQE